MSDHNELNECNFGRLFVQHEARIFGYIRTLVVHQADAEDLLQDTAAVLWKKFSEYQVGSNFLAWAMSVARFEVQRFRREQKHNVLHFSAAFCDVLAADTVAESVRLREVQRLFDECIEKLPAADHDLLVLHYSSDATTASLAARLGRPASTIYDAIRRGRRALVDCVQRSLDKENRQ
jgi:RNA polymerase sigma-70 factor, ECF subfamily